MARVCQIDSDLQLLALREEVKWNEHFLPKFKALNSLSWPLISELRGQEGTGREGAVFTEPGAGTGEEVFTKPGARPGVWLSPPGTGILPPFGDEKTEVHRVQQLARGHRAAQHESGLEPSVELQSLWSCPEWMVMVWATLHNDTSPPRETQQWWVPFLLWWQMRTLQPSWMLVLP